MSHKDVGTRTQVPQFHWTVKMPCTTENLRGNPCQPLWELKGGGKRRLISNSPLGCDSSSVGDQLWSPSAIETTIIVCVPLTIVIGHLQLRTCRRHRFDPWVGKVPWRRALATHSSVLAWRIPWTEDPGWLQSMGLQRVGHDWSNLVCTYSSHICDVRHYMMLSMYITFVKIKIKCSTGLWIRMLSVVGNRNSTQIITKQRGKEFVDT